MMISILGGLLFRIRGGWLGDIIRSIIPWYGTFWGRVIFSIPTSILVAFLLSNFWYFLTVIPIFVGLVFGWGEHFTVRNVSDFLYMSLRGSLVTIFLGISLILASPYWWIISLSGTLMGIVYYIGSLLPLKISNFNQGPEISEFLFGTYYWLVLLLVLGG